MMRDQVNLDCHTSSLDAVRGELAHWGRWLVSIASGDDAMVLRQLSHTEEYRDFVRTAQRLELIHQQGFQGSVGWGIRSSSTHAGPNCAQHLLATRSPISTSVSYVSTTTTTDCSTDVSSNTLLASVEQPGFTSVAAVSLSFNSLFLVEEMVDRVFHFLDSFTLVQCRRTCTKFRSLVDRHLQDRTRSFATRRQLTNTLMMLRASEQLEGYPIIYKDRKHDSDVSWRNTNDTQLTCVRIPTLLLRRRVLVSNSGDVEFNGLYHCTGCNGNGFVFTKPRHLEIRVRQVNRGLKLRRNQRQGTLDESLPHDSPMSKQLRCIISKRFSNETILWYLSKEMDDASETSGRLDSDLMVEGIRNESEQFELSDDEEDDEGSTHQFFAFWAKLMVIGDAPADICRYPSQTSVLSRTGEGWESLSTTLGVAPPTVELV